MSLSKPYPSKPVIAQLFAPFWLVNKTGMKLILKSGDILWEHQADATLPLLFSFKPGKLFKQKMQMMVQDSLMSDSFSIDAVGNTGNIFCRGRDKDNKSTYCVSIDIALSSFSLTKIVTFSPFYSVVNRTNIFVEVSDDKSSWFPVNPTSKVEFWPKDASSGKLFVKSHDGISTPVTFKESNSTLVTVGNDLFNVLVDVTDSGIKIQLSDYDEGSCPVRIFNSTPYAIQFWQQGCNLKTTLNPFYSVYFLWTEPSGVRQLVWKSIGTDDSEEVIVELIQDVFGSVEKKDGPINTFWVSFLDGRQRTLLITNDSELTTAALQATEFTKPNVTLDVSMKGLGVSIVNDENQKDLIYLGVSGSEAVWEVRKPKSKRFKTLQLRQIEIIEAAYQRELTRLHIQRHENLPPRTSTIQLLANKIKVDMTDINRLIILEPVRGELRRHSSPGFFAQLNLSDHVTQAHAKISRVQIDNQQDNCLFSIIMCPVTPPKSISQDRAPKPFIEFSSVLQRTANLNRFKYLSVLVQEFLVQIDGAFLLSMADFFGKSDDSNVEINYEKLIAKDVKQLSDSEVIDDENEVVLSKAYYDLIHFSPIKVHVSFSLGGISSFQVFGVLDLLMRSAGVTLTEFKDVTFKIDFFERKNLLLDNQQLVSQATTHYIRQVLKQFYVIVLGLDVIGNPVGLFLGLKQGVGDFFYEPLMGIIEGPEEFAEGLALGVKSLFSHTFGGAAGALSKITGTLGEGVSALTMDDEFIRRRRMRMQRKQNVAESGKELAQGFWRGLTGIIRKPIEGARDDGFEGLMKGIGKGAVGFIAQPATGVIDFASGSLGALKRAVDINQEAKKQRPPRFFQPDNILRPYNRHEATGHQILQSLDKGNFSQSDNYISHFTLKHPANVSKELVIIISDVRVFVLKESCLYSTWDIEWKEDFVDIELIDIHNMSVLKFVLKVSCFFDVVFGGKKLMR
jgi:vacuolar protein sorting-associated protein 13A/C